MTEIEDIQKNAAIDCVQDDCENNPFGCIGGLGARLAPKAPAFTYLKTDEHRAAYLDAYIAEARRQYGDDWATCSFGWQPALTIIKAADGGEGGG